MIQIKNLYSAAGFLEAEGSFYKKGRCPTITAPQVEKEPLLDLLSWFGGKIHFYKPNTKWKSQNVYTWVLGGQKAAALMMTLYSLMKSKRRSQIGVALKAWRSVPPKSIYRKVCPKGHPFTPENTAITHGNVKLCRTCRRINYKLKRVLKVRVQKQHCPQGHPYTPENTRLDKKGCRNCRTCARIKQRAYGHPERHLNPKTHQSQLSLFQRMSL